MSEVGNQGPVFDPGLCRCCGSLKKCRVLTAKYHTTGPKEIYSDMFLNCFALVLTHLDGADERKLICARCVKRLKDAYMFKKQVMECEQIFQESQTHIFSDLKDSEIKEEHLDNLAFGVPLVNVLGPNNKTIGHSESDVIENNIHSKIKKNKMIIKRVTNETMERSSRHCSKRNRRDKTGTSNKSDSRKAIIKKKKQMAHLNTVRIVKNSYVCPFGSSFSDYYCVYCKTDFTDPELLREHTMEHDSAKYREIVPRRKPFMVDIVRIDCRLCSETIDNIKALKNHLDSSHNVKIYDVDDEFVCFKLGPHLQCTECGSDFAFFHALKNHMASHFGTLMCDTCGAYYFHERSFQTHLKKHRETSTEAYPCEYCPKSFGSKHSKYLHEARMHRKEPTYACPKCDQSFLSYVRRYRHLIQAHGQSKVFKCRHCEKSYDSRKGLREHNRTYHLKIRKHECDICQERFYLPSRLKEHMVTHTGEKNFECEHCGKSYMRLRSLKVHMQTHSETKRFRCKSCDASFTQNVSLKNHVRKHHPDLDSCAGI